MSTIAKYFKLDELNTSVRTEFIAGLTTFVSMAYICLLTPLCLVQLGWIRAPFSQQQPFLLLLRLCSWVLSEIVSCYRSWSWGENALTIYSVVISMGVKWLPLILVAEIGVDLTVGSCLVAMFESFSSVA